MENVLDLSADQAPKFVVTTTILLAFTTNAVILRLISRRIAHARLWWDDVLIIFGFVSSSNHYGLQPLNCFS